MTQSLVTPMILSRSQSRTQTHFSAPSKRKDVEKFKLQFQRGPLKCWSGLVVNNFLKFLPALKGRLKYFKATAQVWWWLMWRDYTSCHSTSSWKQKNCNPSWNVLMMHLFFSPAHWEQSIKPSIALLSMKWLTWCLIKSPCHPFSEVRFNHA